MITAPQTALSWHRDAAWLLTVWLIAVVLIGGMASKQAIHYRRLSRDGITIEGTVLGPKPHGQISYSYEINGKTYEGTGLPAQNSQRLYEIPAGEKVRVHYLPDAPEISCLGNPERRYLSEIGPILAVSFLFPTLIVIRLAFWVRKKRRLELGLSEAQTA
ncbi:MAG TPA: DUF3592 domain-containing protein [Terriglobales bacterium]|nr:DUF3592 domain-containing protein [Terriglobales bacterium]